MLIHRDQSALLVVDMQTSLLSAIADNQTVLANVAWLMRAAAMLTVPTFATEQYPKGLGPTDPTLTPWLPPAGAVAKVDFSCAAARCFDGECVPEQPQVVICGIESHVCVLQTALDLMQSDRAVFVVADAIGSRSLDDKALAIARLRDCGAQIVSREMVAFEWLRRAGSEEFRAFSKSFLRS